MTPQAFIAKWQRANLSERSAAQQHFLDLCELLGQPKPAAADPDGAWYCFERGVTKSGGGKGWADVWMKGHFAWEYKGKHKNLEAAYAQLLLYREDLENPPLLVVCDLDRFEVHTNFTSTATVVHAFDLNSLDQPANQDVLRKNIVQPDGLKPRLTTEDVTKEVAERFARLAEGMYARKVAPERAAHFLMKLMFCMFAEDIRLLPEKLFSKVLASSRNQPANLAKKLKGLFEAMADGGEFGADTILHFNGGLFADADVEELTPAEIEELARANDSDWSNVEPSIFGTLFERTLDPAKRSQIGAHYTSREDILTLLEPVLMAPLRREWEEVKASAEKLWVKVQAASKKQAQSGKVPVGKRRDTKERQQFEKVLEDFTKRLDHVTVLDPACGSGNFLYVALHLLLDLEKSVVTYASQHDLPLFPKIRPTQMAGLEINQYAQQLAQVVIWIGYLQWLHHNGFPQPRDPVLEPIENIKRMDAILDISDPANPREPDWPEAEFIVGNPPFLGGKKLRSELGDEYVDRLFSIWRERVPPEADLCCYWFEKGRRQIEDRKCKRTGLLATQGIRGGANREVLKRIKEAGDIFFAESDRDWILDGANVHVSMVGFDDGSETSRLLDGQQTGEINPNLSATANITQARRIGTNAAIAFMGDTKGGPFDINENQALSIMTTPNPHHLPSSDVLVPWVNGLDVTRRLRNYWIIDFGVGTEITEASMFDSPFAYLQEHLKELRGSSRTTIKAWWLHERPRVDMREALAPLPRFLITTTVSKYRLFVWAGSPTLPDHQLIVFARSDDYFFGVLQSRLHEVWGLKLGTRLETRPRYTPTTCFETFPFPTPTDAQQATIAAAAKDLDKLRTNWLNPPEWTRQEVLEFPGSVNGPWARYVQDADSRGIGTVRYPRIVPKDEDCAKKLQKRTLTNLYNERPTWLDLAHQKLDSAVFAAYGWKSDLTDDAILAALLALNLERAGREEKAGVDR